MKYLREVKIALGIVVCSIACVFMLSANAGGFREFVACKHTTGEKHGEIKWGGVLATGVFKIKPETVVEVYQIQGNKCTMLITNKSQVSVVGPVEQVECRLLGGNNCAAIKAREE